MLSPTFAEKIMQVSIFLITAFCIETSNQCQVNLSGPESTGKQPALGVLHCCHAVQIQLPWGIRPWPLGAETDRGWALGRASNRFLLILVTKMPPIFPLEKTNRKSDVEFPYIPIFRCFSTHFSPSWWKAGIPCSSRRPPGGPAAGWHLPGASAALAAGGCLLRRADRDRGKRRAVPLAELLGPELAAETRLISGMIQLRYDINYDINGYKL